MRHMSFALTVPQVLNRSKTVTRRLRWWVTVRKSDGQRRRSLLPGDLLQPIEKGQGLKKGQKVVTVGGPIRVLTVRRERLDLMNDEACYGLREAALEGFPHLTGKQFVAMFCEHNGCTPDTEVTRIEFKYVDQPSAGGAVAGSGENWQ